MQQSNVGLRIVSDYFQSKTKSKYGQVLFLFKIKIYIITSVFLLSWIQIIFV